MRVTYNIRFEGKTLARWELSDSFEIRWGDLIAVPYDGKLKGFRIVGMTATEILLASAREENRPRCL